MAGGEVTLDRDKLKRSLDKLLELHENITILHDGLHALQGRQDADVWSARGTTFASAYRTALHDTVGNIDDLRNQLCAYRDTLTASADRLALMDAEVQDRLARLAARADGIVTPMPAQNAPWQAPAPATTGYVYDPDTHTGFDPNTGTTQTATTPATSGATLAPVSAAVSAPPATPSVSGIG